MLLITDIVNIFTSLFFISVAIYIFFHNRLDTYKKEPLLQQNMSIYLLLIFAAAAVLVRVWKFGAVPGGFNQDGAMAAVDAKALANYGTDRFGMKFPVHFTAWGYGQMSVLASYMMVPLIKIWGLSIVTARLPILLASLIGIAVTYLFVKEASNSKTAALTTFALCAINPWHIMQSRWILDCNMFPHIFLIGVYFLNKKKSRYVYLSMLFFGLSLYCYGISFYTVPLFLLIACIIMLKGRLINWWQVLVSTLIFLIVSAPIAAMVIVNFFKLETIETPIFTIPYFPDTIRMTDILFFTEHPVQALIDNLKVMLSICLLNIPDGYPWNSIPEFGPYYLPSLPFIIIGFYAIFKRIRQFKNPEEKFGLKCLIVFFGISLWSGLITDVNINRINIIFYPIIIILGFGVEYVTVRLNRVPRSGLWGSYAILFVLFAAVYFTSYARKYETFFCKDFGEAVTYAKQLDCDVYYITTNSQFEGADMTSEILTMFYHDIDAEYFQGKKELIKPDGSALLPYAERYIFFSDKDMLPLYGGENAVFVMRYSDVYSLKSQGAINDYDYNFVNFGDYYVYFRN